MDSEVPDKCDSGKPPMAILPWSALTEVAKVMQWAITDKPHPYELHGWKTVKDGEMRFISASLRHVASHLENEPMDKESGLLSLAHASASMLFALWMYMEKRK